MVIGKRKKLTVFFILIMGIIALSLVLRFETSTAEEARVSYAWPPRLTYPPDQTVFVESDITLKWRRPYHLASNQAFAVRLWYGDQPPIEIWTDKQSLNAQEMIDSFSQEVGTFYWQVVVIQYSEQNGYEKTISEWSSIYSLQRVRRLSPIPFPPEQQSEAVRAILAQPFASTTQLIDNTRVFVHNHSNGEWQDSFQPDYRDAVNQMFEYSQGQAANPPYLMCDGQSTSMLSMLEEMGIESHLIYLYGDGGPAVAQHTVLEVFNPETQRWEIQDPSSDLYFIDTQTQERASINRLVFGDYDTVEACNESGCDPDKTEQMRVYFQAFRVGNYSSEYDGVYWVNPDRFNVVKRFLDYEGANLAELLTGNASDFSFKFSPWPE